MIEVGFGLLLVIGILYLAINREESLPEEQKIEEKIEGSYVGSLKAVVGLMFLALVLVTIFGAGG